MVRGFFFTQQQVLHVCSVSYRLVKKNPTIMRNKPQKNKHVIMSKLTSD